MVGDVIYDPYDVFYPKTALINRANVNQHHCRLNLIVDTCYRERLFCNENECLELLLKLYDRLEEEILKAI